MSIDTAVPIWDVLNCIADPIKDQLRYVISSKKYTRDLWEEVEKLKLRLDSIQSGTKEARNNLGIVYDDVTKWQANAERALMEAQDLLGNFEEAAKTCCYRTLPDLNRLYQFSTKAEDKIENIQRLLRIGRYIKDIYFIDPSKGIRLRDEVVFESRASILLRIMDALADDSKSVVAVYGMGGVGKTKLLSEADRIIGEQKSFHVVASAKLLRKKDIKNVQEAIARSFDLNLTNKEDVEVRAGLLRSRLEYEEKMRSKVLLILDNLSEKLELKVVGIPCGDDNKVRGCKLLLTSRNRNVLTRDMHCDSDSVFRLPKLHEEEAKRLFERTAGEKAHRDEFKPFMDKALHKCAGLPLLIVEMANHFRNASSFELNDALNQIEMSRNEGIGKIINELMQSSYDDLPGDEEVKSLLRLCVVYGVPMPKRENLVRYGIGYVLSSKYKRMEKARARMNTLISTLEAYSLSLDNGDADSFKIHELVYQFVALVASNEHPLIVLKEQGKSVVQLPKDELKSCTAICFPYIDIEKLPEELNCPNLLMFLLFTKGKSLEVSDSYFNFMRQLIVLNLTGIRLTHSSLSSPSPFRFLRDLRTLSLDDCLLEDVSILGELKGLRILSFVNSIIYRLPKEIGQLTELWLLDLNNCSQLETIEPDVLGSLTKLEELYMENSFVKWNAVELKTSPTNACLTELKNMTGLCILHISIPDPSVLPKDLNVENLKQYKIQIGHVSHMPSYKESKTLMIKLNRKSNLLWDKCVQITLDNADYLYLDGLNRDVTSICSLSEVGFPKLKHLCVENSGYVRYILRWPLDTSFKTLESLILKDLTDLEKICNNCAFLKSFNSLKEVQVERCGKIKVLFPFPLARELAQLKEIRVVGCKSMQKIVEVDDCGKVEFRSLHVLKLCDLPDIKNFFTTGTAPSRTSDDHLGTQVAFFNGKQVSIPSLKFLIMKGLPNLKDIWSDESPLGLSNLQYLEVASCESLSKVINFGSLVKLHKLHTLKVAHCVLVHKIFDLARSSASGKVEIPSALTTICLKELPSLRRIWSENPCGIVRFHCLKQLSVFGCNNLKFMFFPSMLKSLEQLRGLTVRNCKIMEAIIMEEEGCGEETSETLAFLMLTDLCFEHLESLMCFSYGKCSQETRNQDHIKSHSSALFNGEVAFPRLETLKITGMDNIEMIWDSQVTVDSFPTLKSICVDECNKLVNIGPSCILQGLRNLQKLEAKACSSVEAIFKLQSLNSLDGNYVAFGLKKLKLIEVPGLKCVWDEELFHQVNFHCPHSIHIFKCESLTSLFPDSIARDLMQLEESEINECGNVELIENTSHASHWPALTMEVHGCNKTEILPWQPENEMPLHEQPAILIRKGVNVGSKGGPSRQLSISAFSIYFNNLKTLKVSHCDGLSKMFTPAIAKYLKRLTKLRISYCKMLTEVISDEGAKEGDIVTFNQLKYMELDGLTRLRCFSLGRCTLEFPLLEDIIMTGCLNMKFFSRGSIDAPKVEREKVSGAAPYREENLNITVENMFEEMAMVARVKFMQLSEFPDLIGKWHNRNFPIKSSWKLESLVVDKCPLFNSAIPSNLVLVLDNMRRLQVRDCRRLEEILDLGGLEAMRCTLLLPELQHLDLVNLPSLNRLWDKDLQGTLLFISLGDLTLYNCSNLRHAFAPSMARCLANLVRMDINECGHMEGVIAEEEGQRSAAEKITFPNLSLMKLECLPNLTSFLSGKKHMLDCPKLEHLIINHCPKMRSFARQSLKEIDHGTSSLFTPKVQFCRLKSMVISHMDNLSKIWTNDPREIEHLQKVDVQNCKGLENLFPHWVAKGLKQLEELRVESCGFKEIVMREDDTPCSSTAQPLFPGLTSLLLHDMPQLKSFCPNLPTLNWPILKELRVTHCGKVNMLHFVTSKNKLVQRDDHQDLSEKEAHSSLERDFPKLERLLLVDKDFQMIQKGKFLDDIFGKLKALTLACFHDENAVFPHRLLLERFQNLQSLEIFCSSFEDIFPEEGLVDMGRHPVLENLRELKLSKLHNLKCVWREDHLVSKMLQSIEKFEVWDCAHLTTIFPVVKSFQNLTELVVKNSSGLIHLVTVSVVTNLVHLTDMTIIGCEKMKEVVANNGNGEGKVISLGKLESLTLQYLSNLVCFSSTTSCIFKFPSLFSIEVEECPKMKIFSKRMLSTPNLQFASLFKHKWQGNWEGDLNTTIQALSAETNVHDIFTNKGKGRCFK